MGRCAADGERASVRAVAIQYENSGGGPGWVTDPEGRSEGPLRQPGRSEIQADPNTTYLAMLEHERRTEFGGR
jgi:hypothetical protein